MKSSNKNHYPTQYELRPNRLLLDSKFQGYKLSLDRLPIYNLDLESDVDHSTPSEEQYSIQHFKLQIFTNHILPDQWNPDIVYIIDQDWNVNKSAVSQQTRKLLKIKKVWNIPTSINKMSGRFNITLCFPNKTHAVLADGCGSFYLLLTEDRNISKEWKVLLQDSPFSACKHQRFIILDSIYYTDDKEEFIDLIFLRLDESTNWKDFLQIHKNKFSVPTSKNEHPFVSIIEWITLSITNTGSGNSNWSRKSLRTYVGRSSLDYASIEPGGTGLYLASNDTFYCSYDSVKSLEDNQENETKLNENKTEYLWCQTKDKITIWFQFPLDSLENDLVVEIKSENISIQYKNHIILNGNLCHTVNVEQVVWTLQSGKLEIIIPKSDELTWTGIIPGNETGEEILDAEKVEHIHTQLSHMCSDKWGGNPHNSENILDVREIEEECDEFPVESAVLMRVDKNLQKITHQASLGNHQWLFNVRTCSDTALNICIRHDVDGILWQPKSIVTNLASTSKGQGDIVESNHHHLDWICEHIATFSAFGYVQASKEFRKFTVCPTDCSYVAICDSVKHIHVYRKPTEIENDLRNRKTGEKISHVSKQHVVSIDSGLEILGAYAANDFMLILTAKNLIAVQMGANEIY